MKRVFAVFLQCCANAFSFQNVQAPFRGVTRTTSFQGGLVKSGVTHSGFPRTSFLISAMSDMVQSPVRDRCKIPFQTGSRMRTCSTSLMTVSNCLYSARPHLGKSSSGQSQYNSFLEVRTGGNW